MPLPGISPVLIHRVFTRSGWLRSASNCSMIATMTLLDPCVVSHAFSKRMSTLLWPTCTSPSSASMTMDWPLLLSAHCFLNSGSFGLLTAD